uniref:Ig-like domain-containing protein n=1 Tax=Anopheles farauti TaxID=69004 RepID=A0A182R0U6_9DIPT
MNGVRGYSQHAKAEVREGQDLLLTCIVPNARPAAQIVWYRANVEYKTDAIDTKTVETDDRRYTVTSKLRLRPAVEDDYIDYTCHARHQAIPEDRPMQATVQLSVLSNRAAVHGPVTYQPFQASAFVLPIPISPQAN